MINKRIKNGTDKTKLISELRVFYGGELPEWTKYIGPKNILELFDLDIEDKNISRKNQVHTLIKKTLLLEDKKKEFENIIEKLQQKQLIYSSLEYLQKQIEIGKEYDLSEDNVKKSIEEETNNILENIKLNNSELSKIILQIQNINEEISNLKLNPLLNTKIGNEIKPLLQKYLVKKKEKYELIKSKLSEPNLDQNNNIGLKLQEIQKSIHDKKNQIIDLNHDNLAPIIKKAKEEKLKLQITELELILKDYMTKISQSRLENQEKYLTKSLQSDKIFDISISLPKLEKKNYNNFDIKSLFVKDFFVKEKSYYNSNKNSLNISVIKSDDLYREFLNINNVEDFQKKLNGSITEYFLEQKNVIGKTANNNHGIDYEEVLNLYSKIQKLLVSKGFDDAIQGFLGIFERKGKSKVELLDIKRGINIARENIIHLCEYKNFGGNQYALEQFYIHVKEFIKLPLREQKHREKYQNSENTTNYIHFGELYNYIQNIGYDPQNGTSINFENRQESNKEINYFLQEHKNFNEKYFESGYISDISQNITSYLQAKKDLYDFEVLRKNITISSFSKNIDYGDIKTATESNIKNRENNLEKIKNKIYELNSFLKNNGEKYKQYSLIQPQKNLFGKIKNQKELDEAKQWIGDKITFLNRLTSETITSYEDLQATIENLKSKINTYDPIGSFEGSYKLVDSIKWIFNDLKVIELEKGKLKIYHSWREIPEDLLEDYISLQSAQQELKFFDISGIDKENYMKYIKLLEDKLGNILKIESSLFKKHSTYGEKGKLILKYDDLNNQFKKIEDKLITM